MTHLNNNDVLDFDPAKYPVWGSFCKEEPKESWLCPHCLEEVGNFMNPCENKKCPDAKVDHLKIVH